MERNDRWLAFTLRAALIVVFLWMVKGLLVPIALGALFALILNPLMRRLRRRLGRFSGQAPLILTIGALVLVVIPFGLIATELVASVNEFLSRDLSEVVNRFQSFIGRHLSGIGARLGLEIADLRDRATTLLQQLGGSVAGVASGFARALPAQIVNVFLFVLSLFYFLRDGAGLLRFLLRLSPFRGADIDELFASIQETVHGAIVGQLVTSAVQGGLTIFALTVFRVPGALLFGVIATLLSILPMIGTTPVTLGAALYLLASGRVGAALGMLVAALLIGVSDNVVRPYVQSSQTRMHPLLTLVSIFGGLEAFGAAGVFLGPVIAAMALWTLDTYAALRQKQQQRDLPTLDAPAPALGDPAQARVGVDRDRDGDPGEQR
jgi:predicted PurR-regulated permease PerM